MSMHTYILNVISHTVFIPILLLLLITGCSSEDGVKNDVYSKKALYHLMKNKPFQVKSIDNITVENEDLYRNEFSCYEFSSLHPSQSSFESDAGVTCRYGDYIIQLVNLMPSHGYNNDSITLSDYKDDYMRLIKAKDISYDEWLPGGYDLEEEYYYQLMVNKNYIYEVGESLLYIISFVGNNCEYEKIDIYIYYKDKRGSAHVIPRDGRELNEYFPVVETLLKTMVIVCEGQ